VAKQRFADLLETHVQDTIQRRFGHAKLDPLTMRAIRQTIKELITSVFSRSTHKLTETSLAWLTDQVFKRLSVGPDTSMADLIIINEHKLAGLPVDDVRLLYDLFKMTDMASELKAELKARGTT
jgi:hypothetical protein